MDDDGGVFLNVLEFDQYSYSQNYTLYTSKEKLLDKKGKLRSKSVELKGQVIKSVLMRGHLNKQMQDYILVIQERSQIVMKSLLNPNFTSPVQQMKTIPIPLLFFPQRLYKSKRETAYYAKNDYLFFMERDNFKVKINRIYFF